MGSESDTSYLKMLVGQTCRDITFVQDYCQLGLYDNGVTCAGEVSVVVDETEYAFPGEGSRDALCSLINQRVLDATEVEDGTLVISFERGTLKVGRFPEHPEWEHYFVM